MYATIPIYYPSLEEAERNDEKELWLESYKINMDCKRVIEDRTATAMTARELDSLIEDLISNYGTERTVIATPVPSFTARAHGLPVRWDMTRF